MAQAGAAGEVEGDPPGTCGLALEPPQSQLDGIQPQAAGMGWGWGVLPSRSLLHPLVCLCVWKGGQSLELELPSHRSLHPRPSCLGQDPGGQSTLMFVKVTIRGGSICDLLSPGDGAKGGRPPTHQVGCQGPIPNPQPPQSRSARFTDSSACLPCSRNLQQ